jgi:hypothetical protein
MSVKPKPLHCNRTILFSFSLDSRLVQLSTDTSSNSLLHDNNNKFLSPVSGSEKSSFSDSPSLLSVKGGKAGSESKEDQPTTLLKKTWSNRVSKYSLLGPGQILPTEQISSGLMVQGGSHRTWLSVCRANFCSQIENFGFVYDIHIAYHIVCLPTFGQGR